MAATQIKEMRAPHDAILDEILASPFYTLKQLSAVTGYSISWLSQVIRSDCFRAAYEARRDGVEAGIMSGITERLQGLAHIAIDVMEEKLTGPMGIDDATDAFDKVLKANGYAPNAKQVAGPTIQNNTFVVSRGELQELRGTLLEGQVVPNQEALPAPIDADKGS